jgi:uncharacterized protein YjbJ (UPF0337 family)
MGSGSGDKAEGKWQETKGKIKEGVGEATDNPDLERKGEMDQAKGTGKQAVGDVKNAGQKVKEEIQDAFE